jgi:hypothetical protein
MNIEISLKAEPGMSALLFRHDVRNGERVLQPVNHFKANGLRPARQREEERHQSLTRLFSCDLIR